MKPDARSIPVRSPPEEPHASHAESFLSRASSLLASSLDLDETLRNVASAALPDFADWCAVDVRAPDGRLRRVAVAHPDPAIVRLAHEIHARWPPKDDAPVGAARAARTGESILVSDVDAAQLDALAQDDEHRAALGRLGIRSFITVAIPSASGPLGAITFARAQEDGRAYEARDLAVAEELARRASIAVDRARLHGEAEAGRERLRSILDGIDGIVWEAEPETLRFTFVSQQAEAILGYPTEAWRSEPDFWVRHIHPRDREWAHDFCATRTRAGEDHEFEYRMMAADGRVVWLLDKVFLERDAEGRVKSVRGIMVDITQRKTAERRFAAQHQVTSILSEARSLDEASPHLLRVLCDQLEWDVAGLWRADGDGLSLVEMTVSPDVDAASFVEASRAIRLTREQGLPGRVVQSGRAEWLRDVTSASNFARAADAARVGVRGAIAFPIWGANGVLGVVELFSQEPREPDGVLLGFMDTLGWQMGQYIDRKAAEAAVRQSNARRGAILGASLDAIVTIDSDGVVTEWNPAAEQTFGWTRADIIGQPLADVIVPERLREGHREGLARAVRTGKTSMLGKRLEMPALHRDGHEFPVDLAIVQIPGSSPPEFTGFIRDITARKRGEQELIESRHRYEQILDSVQDLVYCRAADASVTYVNAATRRHYGIADPQQGEGAAPPSLRATEDDRSVFERGAPLEILDEPNVRHDGEPRVFHTIKTPIFDTEGRVVEVVGVSRDVTDRKRAGESLRFQTALLESQMEAMPVGLLVVSPEGRIISWNGRLNEMWGVNDPDVDDAPVAGMIERMVARVEPAFETSLRGISEHPQGPSRAEIRLSDGRVVDLYGAPVRGEDGAYHGRIWTFRDVTEERRAEEQRTALLAEVQRHRQRLDAIVASVPGVVWEAWGAPDASSQRIDFVSEHVVEMLGYTREEWLAEPNFWLKIVHPDDKERAAQESQAHFEGGKGGSLLFRWVRKDGRAIWVQAWNMVIHDADGNAVGMRGVTMDVTARVEAEEAVQRERTLLETIIQQMPAGVIVAEAPSGRLVMANEQVNRILGHDFRPAEGLAQYAQYEAYAPDGRRLVPEEYPLARALVENRVVSGAEVLFRTGEGRMVPLIVNAAPVRAPDGTVVAAVADFTDITDRKNAEEAIRESEKRYRFLADAVPEQVWTATEDGKLDYVNQRVVEFFGRAAEDIIGHGWQAYVHDDDRAETLDRWQTALDEGKPYEAEFRLRRHDGAHRWHIARALPLRDEHGRVVKWFGANVDITDNKNAQAALSARAEELANLAEELEYQRDLTRTITDNTASALFMMDKDGNPTFLNPAALAMTGYSSLDEIRGKPLHDAVHFKKPDGSPYPMDECPIDRANADIAPLKDRREVFCRKDGTLFPVAYNLAPVEKDGVRLGAVLEARDITEEVAAEDELMRRADELSRLADALADQRNLIELITDNATSCLFMMDVHGRPTYMNPEAERVTGFTLDEIRERTLHDAIHHKHSDGSEFPVEDCPLDRAHDRIAVLRDHRDLFIRKDGSTFHALSSIVPIERDGQNLGAVVELRDITPLVEAENQLKQRALELAGLAAALERSNRELDQFAYVTSHDLKAPLRGIANLASWIEEDLGDAVDETAHKHLDLLRGRVHRMEALIDAILQYSRVGRIKLRPEAVDVNELLAEAVDLLSPPHGFVVNVEGKMPEVLAERSRLQQVFLNLIGNAVKHHHAPAHGRVDISVEDEGDAYAFTVADNGPGIAARFHDKVFVIFQTLEARDKVEGTGVGLALVKKIIQTQGGTIELDSDEGRGARFRFTWPKQPPQ